MATCGGLRSLFETVPLPENPPTLMESLTTSSWQSQMPKRPLDHVSFTEIFGELHFQEKTPLASTIFSWKSSDSLQLCTEGLGSESSDDVDDMSTTNIGSVVVDDQELYARFKENMDQERLQLSSNKYKNNSRSSSSSANHCKVNGKGFPPPISSIGRSGKPWVCFKAYREDGRFVLREIRMPTTQEVVLRASRHDGRLKLRFACPDQEDIVEGDEGGHELDDDHDETIEEEEERDDESREEVDEGDDQEAESTEFVSRA